MNNSIDLLGRGESFKVRLNKKEFIRVNGLRYLKPGDRDFCKNLPSELPDSTLLLYGADSPLIPAVLRCLKPEMKIDIFTNELHDKRIAEKKFTPEQEIGVFTGSDLNLEEDYDMLVFSPSKYFDRMLFYDTLERLNLIAKARTPIYIIVPAERQKDFKKKMDSELRAITEVSSTRANIVYRALIRGAKDVKKTWTPREAIVEVSTVNAEFKMMTRPGVFSHGRADTGGVALSEVVEVKADEKVLDLGCGAGLIGLAVAQRQRDEKPYNKGSVTLVDSNVRSIECCEKNIELNGFENCQAIASDLYETDEKFDLVVGNPPYFAGQRIGEYFIETAMKYLKDSGRLALVSKHGDKIAETAKDFGFKTENSKRKGYDISLCYKA